MDKILKWKDEIWVNLNSNLGVEKALRTMTPEAEKKNTELLNYT